MKTKTNTYPQVDVRISNNQLSNAVNITERGICVIVDTPLSVGKRVDLDLSIPNSSNYKTTTPSNPINLEGVSVWIKYSELLDKYELGIKFTNIDHQSKRE